ncbi:hypothetical protein EYS14_18750 [Alteromonadaceae bacterium M269]|nr:hypothetical protein EYS14_18750 [Alteromonadaceae bacterium M269]
MKTPKSLTLLFIILATTLLAPISYAHQQKAAISSVLFNPRTKNIEVSHRFYLHDAEHAVKKIFGGDADIYQSADTQQKFANYVIERFAMYNNEEKQVELSTVGFEQEGKFFWVYQETAQPPELKGLTIAHHALRDIWPEQVNTINVEGKGDLQTLTFAQSVELLKVEFDHH